MSIVGNTSATIGTILNTVNNIAVSTSRAINSASAGLDMLDTYVQNAKTQQEIASHFDMANYVKEARQNAQLKAAQHRERIESELNANQKLKAHYVSAQKEFDELEQELLSRLNPAKTTTLKAA